MGSQVYIVEDHPISRRGIASVIEADTDMSIIGSTGSAAEAKRDLRELQPDIVLIDLTLEEGSGLTLIEDLHATHPDLALLVVSMHDESLYARRALESGAHGYVMKSEAYWKIVEAIEEVLEGRVYLSNDMMSKILSQYARGYQSEEKSALEALSNRELEVYSLMGQGYDRQEIAEALALSPRTVDTYRDHLREKLSVDTSAKLRRRAIVWVETGGQPSSRE